MGEKWTGKEELATIKDDDVLLAGDSGDLISGNPTNKYVKTSTLKADLVRRDGTLTAGNVPKVATGGSTLEDSFITQIDSGDDKGIAIVGGQLSVGAPGDGQEVVVGEGDSYPIVGAWHCEVSNTTNQVVTDAVDVTEILQSDELSTTGLFGGPGTGRYILVYSDSPFGGVKVKVDTAGTVEPANIIGEYLSSLNTWTTSKYMVADSSTLEQYGNVIAANDDSSEQWRYGFNPLGNIPVDWDELTFTINSIEYTGYFARFRITSDITLDPVIQQIKMHTNRYEINANGRTEYFGIARYVRTIPVIKSANAEKNPPNENIEIAIGITEIRTDNEFSGTANDGLILRGVLPEGFDTSIPIQLVVDWYPKTVGAGDVELELELANVGDDFVFDGTAAVIASTPVVTSVDNNQYEKQRSIFLVDASNGLPGDTIYGSLFRDATAANTDDTYAGNIVITNYQVLGYFWKP